MTFEFEPEQPQNLTVPYLMSPLPDEGLCLGSVPVPNKLHCPQQGQYVRPVSCPMVGQAQYLMLGQ